MAEEAASKCWQANTNTNILLFKHQLVITMKARVVEGVKGVDDGFQLDSIEITSFGIAPHLGDGFLFRRTESNPLLDGAALCQRLSLSGSADAKGVSGSEWGLGMLNGIVLYNTFISQLKRVPIRRAI